jgi:hypothetical protein
MHIRTRSSLLVTSTEPHVFGAIANRSLDFGQLQEARSLAHLQPRSGCPSDRILPLVGLLKTPPAAVHDPFSIPVLAAVKGARNWSVLCDPGVSLRHEHRDGVRNSTQYLKLTST